MRVHKVMEYVVLLGLFIAVIGTGYMFIATLIFKDLQFSGFFNTWHFPMLLAIFIDIAYYKHINRLRSISY